ncbi:hypothetical protein HAN_1g118 (nucleomorph) [Hemiselmis andersenii]|uniref:FACT complex subunit n=3 Tax=Hemiselmis andersenii TaxID=464988 RepID=A9BKC5_HEMAN|nr:hypothetical protein HAN_1g118 [Hemiselmis andersenii]ABW97958.1 hypothetical protein HAN_1g118 [Hemiselmis andersenii]
MRLDWKFILEKIYSFFFFWKKNIEHNTVYSQYLCFHLKEIFNKYQKDFLVFFNEKKIVFLTKNDFEIKFIEKISFKKFVKIENIYFEDFLKKNEKNLIFKLNSAYKSRMGLGPNFSFYQKSHESFNFFNFLKKNFSLENISLLFKNFERKFSQGNIFLTIRLNFSIISLIRDFFLSKISKINYFNKKRTEIFLPKISKKTECNLKNNFQKFFLFFEIKKNFLGFSSSKKIKKSFEKGVFSFSIFCNFFKPNSLFLIEKTFLINPIFKQMILYQLFIELNNLFFKKFVILYDIKNFSKKKLSHFLHIFSENIKFKLLKIINFKKKNFTKQKNKRTFGILYNVQEFFSKNFDKEKGVFDFFSSQNFFLSSRGIFISISFFFQKNLKKITFFLKKISSKNRKTEIKDYLKLFELINLFFFIKKKNLNKFPFKKKIKKSFFEYLLKKIKNCNIVVPESLLKFKHIFLKKEVNQFFLFFKKTFRNFFFWTIKNFQIFKFCSVFFLKIDFYFMKFKKKGFFKSEIKNFSFFSKRKTDFRHLKSKILNLKFPKKNFKRLEKENYSFSPVKNLKKNILELKNIFYEKNRKGRKKKGTVQLYQNYLNLISNNEMKNFEIFYKNIKFIFYEINFLLNSKIIHIHFLKDSELTNLKNEKNLQFFYENYETKVNLGNGKKEESSYSEKKEFDEKFKIKKCTNEFNRFVKALALISGKNIEIFNSDFGFFGIFQKKNLFLTPTKNCLVCLSDQIPLIIPYAFIEIVYFERLSPLVKNFDLVFVFKNFLEKKTKKKEKWIRISSVYHKSLSLINFFIKKFIIECFEGNLNLNWKFFLEEIQKEETFYEKPKNWKILLTNKEDYMSENSSIFDRTFKLEESSYQDLKEKINNLSVSSITDELNWEDLW